MMPTTPKHQSNGRACERAQHARENGDHELSLKICKDGLACEPNDPEVLNLAGVVCCELAGRTPSERRPLLDEAIGYFRRAVTNAPGWSVPQLSLAYACQERGRPLAAERAFRSAIGRPGLSQEEALGIGSALASLGCEDDAEMIFRGLVNTPLTKHAVFALVGILQDRREHDKAIGLLRQLLQILPNSADVHCLLGICLSEISDFDDARHALAEALRLDPSHPGANYRLAIITQYRSRNRHVRALEKIVKDEATSEDRRLHAHFALGEAFDDMAEPKRAFFHLKRANRLHRKKFRFDLDGSRSAYDEVVSVFSPEFFRNRQNVGVASDAPIFVLGLPRSGTSLVEQILGRHKDVVAAGELKELKRAILRALEKHADARPYPSGVEALDAAGWQEMAKDYLRRATPAGGTKHFVDKAPLNAARVPLIAMAFPNAKIVHCVRDPRDVGLSLYQRHFRSERHYYYCYDLAELGKYIRLFTRFMDHWRDRLPGRIIEVSYDALVAEPEPQIRRLIELCGLPWDDSCLKEGSHGVVRTASLWQVRQPIYSRSSGRWKKYEQQLRPLLEALGDSVV